MVIYVTRGLQNEYFFFSSSSLLFLVDSKIAKNEIMKDTNMFTVYILTAFVFLVRVEDNLDVSPV